MNYTEIEGDLIALAKQGHFDVIAHGCNCFCRQKSGIAKQMVEAFGTDYFPMEKRVGEDDHWENTGYGDINKLGNIDYEDWYDEKGTKKVTVVNCYTQYKIKKFNEKDYEYTTTENPLDYEALDLCLRKLNHIFKGKHIGLPQIGAGKAGGDWEVIKSLIQYNLKDCNVTVVIYKP